MMCMKGSGYVHIPSATNQYCSGYVHIPICLFVCSSCGPQAWEQLAQDSGVMLKQLVAQPDILKSVALYHVLPRALAPTQLSSQPAWQGYWAGYVLFANEVCVL